MMIKWKIINNFIRLHKLKLTSTIVVNSQDSSFLSKHRSSASLPAFACKLHHYLKPWLSAKLAVPVIVF